MQMVDKKSGQDSMITWQIPKDKVCMLMKFLLYICSKSLRKWMKVSIKSC